MRQSWDADHKVEEFYWQSEVDHLPKRGSLASPAPYP